MSSKQMSDGDFSYDNRNSYGVESDRWAGPVNAEEFYADHLLDLLAESCGPLIDDDVAESSPEVAAAVQTLRDAGVTPEQFERLRRIVNEMDLPGVLDPEIARDGRARIRKAAAA